DGPLQPGPYTLTVSGLKDRLANPLTAPFVLDFTVTNVAPYVLENRGPSWFTLATPLGTPLALPSARTYLNTNLGNYYSNSWSIAKGHFTHSGHLDLVQTNWNNKTLSVYLGNGNGFFQSPFTLATGTNPLAVAVADFNGDGLDDIAVSNYSDATVS